MQQHKKPYKPFYMKKLSRQLRKSPTPAEKMLWESLRKEHFFGYRFRRQAPFGRYIFDFYCVKKKLVIELDGSSHYDKKSIDKNRDDYLSGLSIKVLRFHNEAVFHNLKAVLNTISEELNHL
jgi:very-short-patch-repair endonuclease